MTKTLLSKELFFSKTNDYLNIYLPCQAHKSPRTIKTYRDGLSVFRRYIWNEKRISINKFRFDNCTYDFLLDYLTYLKDSGNKATTCNNRMASIKSYLWYVADGDISMQGIALAASKIPRIKEPKVNRPVIQDDDFFALLSAPMDTKIGIRDKTIMVLLYDSAIRVSELVELQLNSLNLSVNPPYIEVHGKGDKNRIVALSEKTVSHLQLYLKYYHSDSNRNTPLFYTIIKGHLDQMSTGNVERLIRKYTKQIRAQHPNLPDSVSPHVFRRTRATNLYQDGVELELVSRILGHSSTETTRIYATPSLEMLKEAMEHKNDSTPNEIPLWKADEDELARLCGLR